MKKEIVGAQSIEPYLENEPYTYLGHKLFHLLSINPIYWVYFVGSIVAHVNLYE